MNYPTIKIEGSILSSDILEKIEQSDITGQNPKDFGFETNTKVKDEIAVAWADTQSYWKIFKRKTEKLKENDTGATETRQTWIIPFLGLLGYQVDKSNAEILNEKSYAISHRATNLDAFPVHITGCNEFLDKKPDTGLLRMSPHSLVQEYLNITEHLYAIVTNGYQLRILRDASRLVKLSYLEFNLEQMFEEEHYSDFALMYRLIHSSRMPGKMDEGAVCLFEKYHQDALESGSRIREKLAIAVENVMYDLANGFLSNIENHTLKEKFDNGLNPKEYYQIIRKLVYKLLFLMVIEDRNLIFPQSNMSAVQKNKREIYYNYYSISRIRKISENRFYSGKEFDDLWIGLLGTFRLFESGASGEKLGISPLNGDLFSSSSIALIEDCKLKNSILLACIKKLNVFENEKKQVIRINYSALDVEELGSVYESLLELQPIINKIESTYQFSFGKGTERKTTGSYYTRHDLVQELIKSALIPVVQDRLNELPKTSTQEQKIKTILSIKVCDSASGSGHFLLAAARTLAIELARIKTVEDNPSPSVLRESIREVIQHCIYGVDKNPDAVELCRIALWLEGHSAGKPLSFLEHRIKCGDSLVGVDKPERILNGIPDEAFNPVTGDDKATCQYLKKLNKKQRTQGAQTLGFGETENALTENKEFAKFLNELENLPENNPDDIYKKVNYYNKIRSGSEWYKEWTACNIWTSAFFFNYTNPDDPAIPTTERLNNFLDKPMTADGRLVGKANAIAQEYSFFHWHLEFPEIFEKGGFDVVLGNPPWERIKLQEQEFFATKEPEIANAPNKAGREKLIKKLPQTNPALFKEYQYALHYADSSGKFLRNSQRFPLTSSGDINTYSIFSELVSNVINEKGRAGIIVPTGIATDDTNKKFFSYLMNSKRLNSLIGFENESLLFPSVHHSFKFCLLSQTGSKRSIQKAVFSYFNRNIGQLSNKKTKFEISIDELQLINPNTKTCPIFRTRVDAEITAKIYKNIPVLLNEEKNENPWGISFMTMFHMSNDSGLFSKEIKEEFLQLYEAKLFFQYDHRYTTYENATQANLNEGNLPQLTIEEHVNSMKLIKPMIYVPKEEVLERLNYQGYSKDYLIAFRGISSSISERSLISSILPISGVSNSAPIIIFGENKTNSIYFTLFLSSLNCIIADYSLRQKLSGNNLNFFILKQVPIPSPQSFKINDVIYIVPKIIELTYTAWDIKAFADDVWKEADEELKEIIKKQWEESKSETGGHKWEPPEWAEIDPEGCPLPPFKWNEDRRARLKAELDAYYAKLYQLTDEELRYILDPQDVYGEDFPGETFRVLKEKEIRKYGEYRTKRLVLEAWEKLK